MPGSRPQSPRSPKRRCAASSISRRRSTRGSRCSRDLDDGVIDRCRAERVRIMPGARDAGPHDAGERRACDPGLGRLHRLRRAGRGRDRLRPARSPTCSMIADGRLDRHGRQADRRRRDQARDAARRGDARSGCDASDAGGRRRRQRHPDDQAGRARRRLSRQARRRRRRRGARIDHGDLTALLFAQGICAGASG